MNLTQNDRLNQVTANTLIVGVDIGSKTHFLQEHNIQLVMVNPFTVNRSMELNDKQVSASYLAQSVFYLYSYCDYVKKKL